MCFCFVVLVYIVDLACFAYLLISLIVPMCLLLFVMLTMFGCAIDVVDVFCC